MKVLQVGSSMPDDWGGIERYVATLAQALAARGHRVTGCCAPGSPLASRIGVPVLPTRVRHKYDLVALARYVRLFRAHRYDIVNTHFSPDYLVPAWAARIAGQRGAVLTRHLVLPMRPSRVRTYLRLYQGFVGVSEAVSRGLVASGVPAQSVATVRAGVPDPAPIRDRETIRSEMAIEAGLFAVGVFGRLVEEKGHRDLFAALGHCRSAIECHVFGDGPMRAQLAEAAKGLPIKMHGYVTDVAEPMLAMDVVALPSRCEEALGIAVLEAFALGRPVVAPPFGGIPEAVRDGVNGRLVQTSDPRAFADALDSLATSYDELAALGHGARQAYLDEFTPDASAAQAEAAYSKVLDG